MKCANPECNRGIGLVHYRRGWFNKRRYCSKNCRDAIVVDLAKQSEHERSCYDLCRVAVLHTNSESTGEVLSSSHPRTSTSGGQKVVRVFPAVEAVHRERTSLIATWYSDARDGGFLHLHLLLG